jgi:hypothetical protein
VSCEICKAKKGQPCHNTIEVGEPLPGRVFHDGRIQRLYCQGCGMPHTTVESCGRNK